LKIRWLGHSCFLITSANGKKIITDPYTSGDPIKYGAINESADVVLISHEHGDHNNPSAVKGNPIIVKGAGTKEAKGLKFKGIPVFHDDTNGSQRGKNTIFVFELDEMRVCHLGDLGHKLSSEELAEIGKVDILFIPVGGFYTIDGTVASEVAAKIGARVIIPMHFLTPKIDAVKFGAIVGPEEFTKGKKDVRKLNTAETEIKAGQLPSSPEIIVFKPAL
jgi:L-ascorbate metabolism protein UlaG (beta-lactamase superfamily)